MSKKINLQILKIFDHIISIAFVMFMNFLRHRLDDMDLFITICIPSVIFIGLSQGISMLLIHMLENDRKKRTVEDN